MTLSAHVRASLKVNTHIKKINNIPLNFDNVIYVNVKFRMLFEQLFFHIFDETFTLLFITSAVNYWRGSFHRREIWALE